MEIAGVIASVLFGGAAGILLGRWLGRPRADITLVSITKGRTSDTTMSIPDDVLQLSDEFMWATGLESESNPEVVDKVRRAAKDVIDDCPEALAVMDTVRKEMYHATSLEEGAEVMRMLAKSWLINSALVGALFRKELTLPDTDHSEDDPTCFDIFTIEDRLMLQFDHGLEFLQVSEMKRESAMPYVKAMQYFDVDVIAKCLDFAKQSLEKDSLRAKAMTSELEKQFQYDPLVIEAVAVNNGDRVTALSPYSALITKDGHKKIPPAPLRVFKVIENDDREIPIPEDTSTYVMLEPKSTKRLLYISDQLDSNTRLKSAYESEVLRCSLTIMQMKSRGKIKKIRTAWKGFGRGIKDELRKEILELK